MKIRIDEDLCTGHGRCYALAPELFDADDETGYGVVIGTGEVTSELRAAADRAVNNCPERAVVLDE
jgi:ferredoxin